MEDKLALQGGSKAVTLSLNDPWPVMNEAEIQSVVELMRTGQISIGNGTGPIGEFERRFAEYTGAKYALMHNNGTGSLHAGFYAVGVGPGDEVIVPSYTWHATAGGVVTANAIPIFCESDPKTLTIDPADVARRITPRTKAIAVVHMWGNIADMDGVMEIARRHNLKVVEDCSHAHGGTWRGKQVGTIGDVGCFSMQGSKILVAGEGGVLITNDPKVYDRALLLGHFGRIDRDAVDESDRAYSTGFGVKYRAHPLGAAIALGELAHLDEVNALRKQNFEYLIGWPARPAGHQRHRDAAQRRARRVLRHAHPLSRRTAVGHPERDLYAGAAGRRREMRHGALSAAAPDAFLSRPGAPRMRTLPGGRSPRARTPLPMSLAISRSLRISTTVYRPARLYQAHRGHPGPIPGRLPQGDSACRRAKVGCYERSSGC